MAKTVLIAESNKVFLEAIAHTVSLLGFSVVGKTTKRCDVAAMALKTRPSFLIFDLSLSNSGLAGCSDLKLLKEHMPELKILALGCYEAVDEIVTRSLEAGFDGFWNKYDNRAGFIKTLNFLFP